MRAYLPAVRHVGCKGRELHDPATHPRARRRLRASCLRAREVHLAINERLKNLLARWEVRVELLRHRATFTSQETAHSSHVPGRCFTKVVVLRDENGAYLMAVVPACERVDLDAVALVSGRRDLTLATEGEMRRLFPDCEPGAEPPFGHLYGMPMFVDARLANEDIYFPVGNHHEVARLRYETFAQLARPFLGDVSLHQHPRYMHHA
jgi:Ala-tRNA(Pro) deacylase